ncbi:nuclear transport factor 2 family protein [Spongiibacter sp. KMU-158]|uniref:Nuclear transport factor 2 family protein n=1 Tax=Spongiibacter pelagi TaxID=2760804 RepID=A0A927BZ10_9GAMM|nr:nuclear transport factor 2 family protein [Spongiibacter pelagi]MBD2858193.1 nuclear transport factor 2 family protein [Spongiibacter pelagi]
MSYAQLALEASRNSGKYASAGDKENWLALFAEDAVVCDPVGKSPLDQSGEGHRGKAAIAAFWDNVIAAGSMDFQIVSSFPAGDECINVVKVVNTYEGGLSVTVDMAVLYQANAEGKICSLRAYWDYDAVTSQLG